jgi:hypothetical protein
MGKEIESLEKSLVDVNQQLEQHSCKTCKKPTPAAQRLTTVGGIYCLDCGFEVLDLLKARNVAKEESQSYKEYYESIKEKEKLNQKL